MSLNQSDALVMQYLLDNEHILPNNTVTVDDVANRNESGLTKATLYKVFKKLAGLGYLKEGLRRKNAKTFYISVEGAKALAELMSTPIEVKEELVRLYADATMNKDKPATWHGIFDEVAVKKGYIEE